MALPVDSEKSPPPPPPALNPSNLSAIDSREALGVLLSNGLTVKEACSRIDDATCFRSPHKKEYRIVDTEKLVESLRSHGISRDTIGLLPYDADVYGNPSLHAGSSTMVSSTTAIPSASRFVSSRPGLSLSARRFVTSRLVASELASGFVPSRPGLSLSAPISLSASGLVASELASGFVPSTPGLSLSARISQSARRFVTSGFVPSGFAPSWPHFSLSVSRIRLRLDFSTASSTLPGGRRRSHSSGTANQDSFLAVQDGNHVLTGRPSSLLSSRLTYNLRELCDLSVDDLLDLPVGGRSRNREISRIRQSSYSLGRELGPLSASHPFYGDSVADGVSTPGWILHGGSLPLYHRNGSPTGSTIRHFSIPNLQSMIRNIQSLFPDLCQALGASTSLVGYPTDGLTGGRNRYSEGPRFRGSSSRRSTAPDTALHFSHVGLIHYLAGISESLRSLQDAIADPNKLISIFRAYEDFMSGKKIPEQAIVSAVGLAGLYFKPQNGNLHGPAFYCLIGFLTTAFTTSFAGNQVQDRHPSVAKVLAKVATLSLVVVFFTVVGSLINNLFMGCFIAICAAICLGSFVVGHLK